MPILWVSVRTFVVQRNPIAVINTLPVWGLKSPIDKRFQINDSNTRSGLSDVELPSNSILDKISNENWASNGAEDMSFSDSTMYADSVLRKRRKKMKKHKLRKRRRSERSLKKRLGKI